ncbi:MAG: HPr family phosphocarrier protein [Gammaproteobacteria bacterium]
MLHKTLIIVNKLGLHARASAKLVDHASRYSSEILLKRGHHQANGKSIMGVMMLAANKGSEIEVIINGEDEVEAMADIETLIAQRFGEAE